MKDTQEGIAEASLQPAYSELDYKTEDDGKDILPSGSKEIGGETVGRDGSVGQNLHGRRRESCRQFMRCGENGHPVGICSRSIWESLASSKTFPMCKWVPRSANTIT